MWALIVAKLTFGVQHLGDVEVLLRDVEGQVEVLNRVVLRQFGVVQQVGPVPVDEGAEGKAVTPAVGVRQTWLETERVDNEYSCMLT